MVEFEKEGYDVFVVLKVIALCAFSFKHFEIIF